MINNIATFYILLFLCFQSCNQPQKGKDKISEPRTVIFPDSLNLFFDSHKIPDKKLNKIVFNINGTCGVCYEKINLLDSIISNSKLALPVDIIINSTDNFELFKYAYNNVIANMSNFSFYLDRDDRFLKMNNLQDSLVLINNNNEVVKIYPFNTEQDAIKFIEFDIESK